MYKPGDEYLSYIKNNQIRKPRSKIIVDGKTYTGVEHLATYPKISQETEKMIGGFPAKTCEFEIYNLDGSLSLNGKEVDVYRGLDIEDNKTVWIPMGLFAANDEDITNNSTKRTIQFKGTDRTRRFDVVFNAYANNRIPAGVSLKNIAEKICTIHSMEIDPSTKKNIPDYTLAEIVGLPEGTTNRQVISWIAELGGCIPIISRDGKYLCFTRPKYIDNAGSYAKKSRYKALSVEPQFGAINALSIGHSDYDDAYVIQDDEEVEANGICEWQINDNSIAESNKEVFAELAFEKIKGMKITPFSLTEFVDDFILDINDGILIQTKDGTPVNSYVLGINTTSRIRSTFKAGTQDSSVADRSLAGSVKQDVTRVKLSVDHVKNEITSLAQESDKKYTEIVQRVDGVYVSLADADAGLEAKITATAEKMEAEYAKTETVNGQIEGVTERITSLNSQVSSINSDLAGINSELDGLDEDIADKVTTEVRKETTIEYLAGQVSTKIKGEYVSQSTYDTDKDKWLLKTTYESDKTQTDQNITSALKRLTTLETSNFITEEQANSLISQSADSISLSVGKSLKIGARNILLNSACFEPASNSDMPYRFSDSKKIVAVFEHDSSVPSGKRLKMSTIPQKTEDGCVFKTIQTIGQEDGSVDKLKPNTMYTLSFWLKYKNGTGTDTSPITYDYNRTILSYLDETAGKLWYVKYDLDRSEIPTEVTAEWQKCVLVFNTREYVDRFYLRFIFGGLDTTVLYHFYISSLKLEEGNIATDWSPSAEDVEQSVNAKIDLCVKTDENGKLLSTISVESNMISISSDYFTLTNDGKVLCKDLTCASSSEGGMSFQMNEGQLIHNFMGETIAYFETIMDLDGTIYESISAASGKGVSLQAGYKIYVNDNEIVMRKDSNYAQLVLNSTTGFGIVQDGKTISIRTQSDWTY